MNHSYNHATFYSGTRNMRLLCLNSPPSLLTFTETSPSAVTHTPLYSLFSYPPRMLLRSSIFFLPHFLTPLFSPLTSILHQHPCLTHYNTSPLQNAELSPPRLSCLLHSHPLFTHLSLSLPLSLLLTSPFLSQSTHPLVHSRHPFFPSTMCLIRLLFLPPTSCLPPFSPLPFF